MVKAPTTAMFSPSGNYEVSMMSFRKSWYRNGTHVFYLFKVSIYLPYNSNKHYDMHEGCTVCTFVIHILLLLLKPRCVSHASKILTRATLPASGFCRFLRLWIAVLVIYPTNQAVIALTFSNYVLQPLFPTCFPPENGLRLLAGVCLCECRFLSPSAWITERESFPYGAQGLFWSLQVETCLNVDILNVPFFVNRNHIIILIRSLESILAVVRPQDECQSSWNWRTELEKL